MSTMIDINETARPASASDAVRIVGRVQNALGYVSHTAESQVIVARRGSKWVARIDDEVGVSETEFDALMAAWDKYLNRLRAGVEKAKSSLSRTAGHGAYHRGNEGEIALMRRRLQCAEDALGAAMGA